MSHGPLQILGHIIKDLFPGDVLYLLNSQEPLIVTFVSEDAVITNTAEVIAAHRPVRTVYEWEREFPINWQGFIDSKDFEIDISPFEAEDFENGMVVLILAEDKSTVRVVTLTAIDEINQCFLTDDQSQIPFSWNERIIPTGVKFDFSDTPEEEEELDDGEPE